MTTRPITQYARSSDAELAYEVMGDGPIDLLLLSYGIPVSAHHDYPPLARHLERLATFSRVIRMDRRGMGMSDPILPDQPATLEQGAEDALAVLDAVGSQQAAILTDQGTTHIGVLLAASHPERVSKLIDPLPSVRTRATGGRLPLRIHTGTGRGTIWPGSRTHENGP